MATNLHRAIDNFIYRIEATTPTSQVIGNRFIHWDPTYEESEPDFSTGFFRHFTVEWKDSDGDSAATNVDDREAWHNFHVAVYYPLILPWLQMHYAILQDRHDLIKALRTKANCLGYSADYPTTDIGLYHRHRTGDELIKQSPEVWELTTNWRCKIRESE